MKNKIISVLLVCVLSFLPMSSYVFAAQNRMTSSEGCYIASSACPGEYIAYAEKMASDFVLSVDEDFQDKEIVVGTPFSFAVSETNMYYFPIVCDGVISYLLRVYPSSSSDSLSGVITQFLASDIEWLSRFTTPENPLYLRQIGSKIVAFIGENEYLLFEYPEEMTGREDVAYSRSAESFTVINAKESADIPLNLHTVDYQRTVAERASITINKCEQQGSQNWCTAFCLAAIIRTVTSYKDVRAINCVCDAFGYVPSEDTTFPWNKISYVANCYGLHPTDDKKLVKNSVLYSEIENQRPIIQAMDSADGQNQHAVVLRSYNLKNKTWGIWNPWYTYYEWYSMSGDYVPTTCTGTANNTYHPYWHAHNF